MKIVILTTETLHHTYFIKEISEKYPIEKVLIERDSLHAKFETNHPFEDVREEYEKKNFFNGKKVSLNNVSDTFETKTVNEPNAISFLKDLSPDIMISFGTGKISKEVIQICPDGIINLHGGNPEEYRGLDSHLWAIYNNDFDNFDVVAHRVNKNLDCGAIILQKPIKIFKSMKLYELRRYNTEICVELVLSAIYIYKKHGHFISHTQKKLGKYYSFMPTEKKEICVNRFNKYTEGIK